MWLLLNQSVSLSHIALGAAIGLLASHGMAALKPEPVRIVSVRPMLRLGLIVVSDIVRSNLAVARIVLFRKKRVSGFVHLPLELRNIHGLTVLACIITATPGTLWVQLDRENSILLVHVLDLIDEDAWIALIKNRYEKLLLDIFGP
ncbi:Na+/H+ antiporter subunit E [Sphingosinicella sp. GR2756]|uniref:Na+/H+ antiporter subunit E n=2 Tax=Sphingosinicella rhizophila TaxID=3050082 RepID=A0ABU3QCE8_9SPHN|nr:Na+/H+ antiporter subunit E [Sphingosinicella sp. GR2756]